MVECAFNPLEDDASALVPVPQPYPDHWFPLPDEEFVLPDGFEPYRMNQLTCDGQYVCVVAQDGVPFTHAFGDSIAPQTVGAESYYMNDRDERPITIVNSAGVEATRPAGTVGFKHSPLELETLEEIFDYHDRDLVEGWGGAIMERAFIRARLVEYSDDSGDYLLAVGGLVPGVTRGEMASIQNSEASVEFYMMRNSVGHNVMQVVTTAIVIQGNTRTSASTDEPMRRASIRMIRAETPEEISTQSPMEEPNMTTESASIGDKIQAAIDAGATGEELRTNLATILAEPLTDVERLEAENARLAEENSEMIKANLVDLDTSPIRKAAINTQDELRRALQAQLDVTYANDDLSVWVDNVSLDNDMVYYSVYTAAEGNRIMEEAFTFDAETHEISLAGSATEVVEDTSYRAVGETEVEEPEVVLTDDEVTAVAAGV